MKTYLKQLLYVLIAMAKQNIFKYFDSELANLTKEEFAKVDLEELTSSLTASEVKVVDRQKCW